MIVMSEADTDTDTGTDSAPTTNLPVGEILRRTRLHYKQTIPDIERSLRIRASQIEAIESGDLSSLPGRVYAIGFVRSYSEFLGLDGDKMVELFKAQSAGKASEPSLNFPAPPSDTKMPSRKLVIVCVIGIVGALGFLAAQSGSDKQSINAIPSVAPAPEPPPMASPVPEPSAAVPSSVPEGQVQAGQSAQLQQAADGGAPSDTAAPEQTPAQAQTRTGLILNIKENSWVEIRDQSGKSMISRVLQAGDQYFVPDRPDLTISLGNAGGVEFEIDGQKLQPIGKVGEVRRALPLDLEYLKKNFLPQTAPAASEMPAPEASAQKSVETPE